MNDILDVPGDRIDGVNTIPVMLGEDLSFRIVSTVAIGLHAIIPLLYIAFSSVNSSYIFCAIVNASVVGLLLHNRSKVNTKDINTVNQFFYRVCAAYAFSRLCLFTI